MNPPFNLVNAWLSVANPGNSAHVFMRQMRIHNIHQWLLAVAAVLLIPIVFCFFTDRELIACIITIVGVTILVTAFHWQPEQFQCPLINKFNQDFKTWLTLARPNKNDMLRLSEYMILPNGKETKMRRSYWLILRGLHRLHTPSQQGPTQYSKEFENGLELMVRFRLIEDTDSARDKIRLTMNGDLGPETMPWSTK